MTYFSGHVHFNAGLLYSFAQQLYFRELFVIFVTLTKRVEILLTTDYQGGIKPEGLSTERTSRNRETKVGRNSG